MIAKEELEKTILKTLQNSGDNILDDDDAVAVLNKSRADSEVFAR
jgi:hypothetical protein